MTILGRSQLDHPTLSTAGGQALYDSINTIYQNISDHLGGRFKAYASIANGTVSVYEHNFGVAFSELSVLIYTGSHPSLTRVSDLAAAGWTVIANAVNPKTKIDITAPATGGPHTFAVFVVHGPGKILSAPNVIDYLDVSGQGSNPSAPEAGKQRLFSKSSDGKLYKINSAGSISGLGGGGLELTAISSSATVSIGKHYQVDTTSAPITLTLPLGSAIASGDLPNATIRFSDSRSNFSTNNLTITPNSSNQIGSNGAGETLVIDISNAWVELSWDGSRWVQNDSTNPMGLPISARSVYGDTSGTAVTAGLIGESTFSQGSNSALSNGVALLIQTYTFPSAGVWMVTCSAVFAGSATSCTQQILSINTANAFSVTPSATVSQTQIAGTSAAPVTSDSVPQLQPLFVSTATASSVYVYARGSFSGGTLSAQSIIRAVRIA